MTAQTVTDANFEQEVLQSRLPVLVDFWAEWCGPCKALAPVLDQVAAELAGQVKVVKVDVDKNRNAAEKFAVRGLPTLVVVNNGRIVARGRGMHKAPLIEWIKEASAISETPPEATAEEFELANGLRVVAIPYARSAKVAIRTLYKFGTADDWGFATLLAGLLSVRPVLALPTPDHLGLLQSIPKAELRQTLHKDAALMVALDITNEDLTAALQKFGKRYAGALPKLELEQQMNAVLFGSSAEAALRRAEAIAAASREELERLHKRYFAPNNAVIVVCGDVTIDDVRRLTEEAYGQLPESSNIAPRIRPKFSEIEAGQRLSVPAEKGLLLRKYVVPSRVTAASGEAESLELLAQILMRPGRLRLPAVSNERANVIATAFYRSASVADSEFVFRADVTAERDLDRVIEDVRANGVTEAELAAAKESVANEHASHNLDEFSVSARYDAVAAGMSIASIEGRPAAFAKVTVEDVNRAALSYLVPHRGVTGFLLPPATAAPA